LAIFSRDLPEAIPAVAPVVRKRTTVSRRRSEAAAEAGPKRDGDPKEVARDARLVSAAMTPCDDAVR